MKLENRSAIVTGSGRGIGRQIALTLAQKGANVLVADINIDNAAQTAAEISQLGVKSLALKVDVSEGSEVRAMVNRTIEEFGKVDILVNNAGIFSSVRISECSEEQWDRIMAINLKSVFLCSQAVMPLMKERKYGKIISLASVAGKVGGLFASAAYAVSKAGVICITKSLAKELAPYGVNVNAIAPGVIETDMTANHPDFRPQIPLARIGKPQEVANCALFLASDDSSYITGATIDVNGGMVMY